MASSDEEMMSPVANSSASRNIQADSIDYISHSISPQDRILLEALQQFIVPHVGPVVRNKDLLRPEAIDLLTALKGFIASVFKSSEPTCGTTVEVSLDKEDPHARSVQYNNTGGGQHSDDASKLKLVGIATNKLRDNDPVPGTVEPGPPFCDYLQRELREHVFNKMPIRVFRFVPQGLHLRISLLDKGAIYTHLISLINQPDCQPMRNQYYSMETYQEAAARIIQKYSGYAILSHTWLRGPSSEVTYADWTSGLLDKQSSGYQKLVNFCRVAWTDHKLTLGWIDTVCINKESSSELDESIRSMYNWYQRSKVCIVHLAATQTIPDIHRDPWFTRGWTLQELLAPGYIKFYNQDWQCLSQNYLSSDTARYGSAEIKLQIHKATTIVDDELLNIAGTPISRRMQLAASREVMREEDAAYSLMGIFNVSIATAYGEGGERAFFRLLQEILNSTSFGVLDLFNWAGKMPDTAWHTSKILPSGLKSYELCSSSLSYNSLQSMRPLAPLTVTHMGVHIPVVLMPGILVEHQNVPYDSIGGYTAIVSVSSRQFPAYSYSYFRLLDSRAISATNQTWMKYSAAVFNIGQGNRGIYIPKTCIAKLLNCAEPAGQISSTGGYSVFETEKPLVFNVYKRGLNTFDNEDGFWIPEDELATYGMQFISLYL